jgi:hypothetical protein
MVFPARFPALRKLVEEQLNTLTLEIENLFETEVAARVSTEVAAQSAKVAEVLNQAVRRLRQAGSFDDAAAVLAGSSAMFCAQAAVFGSTGGTMKVCASRGAAAGVELPLERAAAFRTALETGDPVVAMATESEVSAGLVEAFAHTAGELVALFPIGDHGLLYAWGNVQNAPLELLAQVAAAAPRRTASVERAPDLVSIAPAAAPERAAWSDLDSKERRLHLRAQQFARTEIAQIRLHRAERVKEGRRAANLYGVLAREIDAVRDEFRQKFLSASPSMVDYVHVELMRTLANEDPALLGSGYPGPLV